MRNYALLNYAKAKNKKSKKAELQKLENGVPRSLDEKGQPIIPESADGKDAGRPPVDGTPYFQAEGDNGERILYREDSIKKLLNNNSLRYEANMQAFIDEYRDYSVEVHGLIIRGKGGSKKPKKGGNEQKDFALISNKRSMQKRT